MTGVNYWSLGATAHGKFSLQNDVTMTYMRLADKFVNLVWNEKIHN